MKKVYYICNLRSGKAAVAEYLAEILNQFTKASYEVTVHPTQFIGDAMQCAKNVCDSEQYDLIVISGGDGTLNEVIQGVMSAGHKLPIGYIPFGSTNDFANGLGIPENPMEAVDNIIHGVPTKCDVGGFNDQYFTYVAAFGAMTEISYQTPQQIKNVLGHTAYILNGIANLSKIQPYKMRIEHDNGCLEGEYLYGMVTNSHSVAKLLWLEDIDWADGLFEVTLIRKPASLLEMHNLITSLSAVQIGPEKKYLHYFRTSHLRVTSLDNEPVTWTIDGEFGGNQQENEISIYRAAVEFLIDPQRQNKGKRDKGIVRIKPLELPTEELLEG